MITAQDLIKALMSLASNHNLLFSMKQLDDYSIELAIGEYKFVTLDYSDHTLFDAYTCLYHEILKKEGR